MFSLLLSAFFVFYAFSSWKRWSRKQIYSSGLPKMQYKRMVANRIQQATGAKGREKVLTLSSYKCLELLASIYEFAVYSSRMFRAVRNVGSEIKLSFVDIKMSLSSEVN